ncbi:6-hydroxymethylpterin diphosphokinase MptE-like protein [Dolichospermum flos-aquae]|uniref:DUF115 domain-containing protein n=1 Tax=Dolichospermum flos-aquae CCAP 1403/13F TaxID=315271 RepID=A0A6H2BY98_DOLFA|nr:6-hydroxymethylpterin diphosphokinase MptE-like protein [Dolichospermum flos-aquae]QJB44217.1 DUF115 domain-containing protein [Dolichospermum flos-aquae CCAP 1403/13F]
MLNQIKQKTKSAILSLPNLKRWIKSIADQERFEGKIEGKIEEDETYFRHIRNKFKGQRGFVIGNGPSLKLEDLEKLNSEITIASNKIFLAFDQVTWRPSYYTTADLLEWEKVKYLLHHHFDVVHIPNYLSPAGSQCPTRWFKHLGLAGEDNAEANERSHIHFSADLSLGAFGGCTVTMENLQLAVHLGLDPIYIIGCDHYYKGEKGSRDIPINASQEKNHFIKNYREPGEVTNPAMTEIMTKAYYEAYKFSIANSINIFNATRGGFLEIFPRVDFDSLF